ncbi:hypothetical protein [Fortiea contorta]|uniref:hypothetical protein n=1 Tax=Fortiea contorta TaxID=1892405 RepID=UPI00034D069B|nr:hypothetical protein [Fortiea contorta]
MREIHCENAAKASVEFKLNNKLIRLEFNNPPVIIEAIPGGLLKMDVWSYFRYAPADEDIPPDERLGNYLFSYYQKESENSFTKYHRDYSNPNNPVYTYYKLFTQDYDTGEERFVSDVPIDNSIPSVEWYQDVWVFSAGYSNSTFSVQDKDEIYQYEVEVIPNYKVKCDGCEPGECKASKSRYPGYTCMDCKELEARIKRIGGKLDEQLR